MHGLRSVPDIIMHEPLDEARREGARLERGGYGKAPGNLDLALRAFMSTFDRSPTAMDTKLVDAITALEAVLGTEAEIAFKLFVQSGFIARRERC